MYFIDTRWEIRAPLKNDKDKERDRTMEFTLL